MVLPFVAFLQLSSANQVRWKAHWAVLGLEATEAYPPPPPKVSRLAPLVPLAQRVAVTATKSHTVPLNTTGSVATASQVMSSQQRPTFLEQAHPARGTFNYCVFFPKCGNLVPKNASYTRCKHVLALITM